jgi:hypothetical protein
MQHPRFGDPSWKQLSKKRDLDRKKRIKLYEWHCQNSHSLLDVAEMAGITKSAMCGRCRRLGIKGVSVSIPGGGAAHFFNNDEANTLANRYYEFELPSLKERKDLTEEQKTRRRERERERARQSRKDPIFRLRRNVSGAVYNALKRQGYSKARSTFSALPYTPQQLAEHIEKQFDEKMNWENMGSYWHLDHIIPQAALPYDSYEHPNFKKCWELSNLRPLERMENISKNSIYNGKRYKYLRGT